jgi:hypothetical protein
MRFPIVQLEFTHSLGPPAGRYVVRSANGPGGADSPVDAGPALPSNPIFGPDPELIGDADVLVLKLEGAPAVRWKLRRRRPVEVDAGAPPREVPVIVATIVIGTRALDGLDDSDAFIAALRDAPDELEQWVDDGFAILNRAIAAYRLCAADPFIVGVTRQDARAVRVGYGVGSLAYHGAWEKAIEVPPPPAPRVKREVRLIPQQGLAAVLSTGARLLESEELVLRAALDAEQGRERAAAVGLRTGYELLRAELADEVLGTSARRKADAAEASAPELAGLASRALRGAFEDGDRDLLDRLIQQTGAVIDAWRYEQPDC